MGPRAKARPRQRPGAGAPIAALRTLYLLRHAKSSWDDPELDDHDRPLAARGRRAATLIGAYFADERLRPDLVLCSSAERARETWRRVAAVLGDSGAPPPARFERGLYLADGDGLLKLLRASAPDEVRSVMLVGHNDGLPQLALRLAGEADGDARERMAAKFPTAALAVLTFAALPSWRDLAEGAGRLTAVVAPKQLV